MAEANIDIQQARSALERLAQRFASLVDSAPDAGAAVPGLEWGVADVATHVVLMTEAYIGFAQGDTEPFVDVTDVAGGSIARTSAARLAAEPERDLQALADRLRAATSSLLRATDGRPGDDPVVWNGRRITLAELLGILVGELLVHGLDVAKALSKPWPIEAADARLVLASVLDQLPLLVNRDTTATVTASYDIRIRGGDRVALRIDRGQGSVTTNGGSVDCHVSADPVAMLLVSYGRRSQWGPALTGKLVAWGRKPWLGLRLTRYLVAP